MTTSPFANLIVQVPSSSGIRTWTPGRVALLSFFWTGSGFFRTSAPLPSIAAARRSTSPPNLCMVTSTLRVHSTLATWRSPSVAVTDLHAVIDFYNPGKTSEAWLPEAGGFLSPLGAGEVVLEPRTITWTAKDEDAIGIATPPGVDAPMATPAAKPSAPPASKIALP